MGEWRELIVRVIHIFCGAFWVGAALMLAGFVEPAIGALGLEGGKFIQRLMGPGRFGIFMSLAGLLTALSGIFILWAQAQGDMSYWLTSGYGKAILLGSVAGLVGLVWGLAVNAPNAGRMARLSGEMQAAGAPPAATQLAEISRLQKRLHLGGWLSAFLLAFSLLAMAAARYM